LGWTTYPITLVDDAKGLVSGWLLFTAYEREEMFAWLLTHLNNILGPGLRTVLTDEDSAIVPAIVNFRDCQRPDVAHRICMFHRKVNFTKHVNTALANPDAKEEAMSLFDEICYAKYEGQVTATIEKIWNLLPDISTYLDAEVVPIFPCFTEAFRGDAMAIGYHATSMAESANRLMKRYHPPSIHNLVEIGECYTRSY
jgi:hypothetical protein